jgi:sugar O-acyltransferase (sialic acid O-acetyltransferase NeuD family)
MGIVMRAPMVSVNDESVTLLHWLKSNKELVNRGDLICTVETTKATVDLEAEANGYVFHLATIGQVLKVGVPLAVIADSLDYDINSLRNEEVKEEVAGATPDTRRWTKKAELLARKFGLNIEEVANQFPPGVTLREEEILSVSEQNPERSLAQERDLPGLSASSPEKILLIGGGGGAALAIDIIARNPDQRAVGVLDSNPKLHGTYILGVPVLGSVSDADRLWESKTCDSILLTFMTTPDERADYFQMLSTRGFRFANVIDGSVNMRLNTSIGAGNLIVSGCYLAPFATIRDNNFLAAFTVIEHHSIVGSHCMFGPRVTASGKVTIGDRVRFGMGVFIEPFVSIGSDSVIASGCVLTGHIEAGSIVRAKVSHTIHKRSDK